MAVAPISGLAIKEHKASYDKCLKILPGDILTIDGSRSVDNEWPGWIWCVDKEGLGSWVPEEYLRVTGNIATALEEYDAKELTVAVGDKLIIFREMAGWFWCRDALGQYGWVPVEKVIVDD
jgi:hypothetical protein